MAMLDDLLKMLGRRLAVLAWLGAMLFSGQAVALVVDAKTEKLDLSARVEFIEDTGQQLSIEEVRKLTLRPAPAQGINLSFTDSAVWIRLRLQRSADAPTQWLLEVPYLRLNLLELHTPDGDIIRTGSDLPVSSRAIPHRHHVFALNLEETESVYHLRVRSKAALSVPLVLWQRSAAARQMVSEMAFQFLYYGALLGLLVYNLLLFLATRERALLIYCGFVLFLGLGIFSGNGYGRLFLWQDAPAFDAVAEKVLLALAVFSTVAFARTLLRSHVHQPTLNQGLRALGALMLLIGAYFLASAWLPLPSRTVDIAFLLASIVCGALVLVLAIRSVAKGQRVARFFLAAWTFLWLGALVAALRMFGFLPTNALTLHALQIGSVLEMLFFSLALADLLRQKDLQANRRLQEALAQQQLLTADLVRSEEKLESTVELRTSELRSALAREHTLLEQYVRFGSLISHEFRNCLAIVQSQLALIRKDRLGSPADQEPRLNAMASATRRLHMLFEKWLDGDRLRSDQLHPQPERMDLDAWLRLHIDEHAYYFVQHRCKLQVSGPLELHADARLLGMALNNLLENAVRYAALDSEITVGTVQRTGQIGVFVQDQGPGIPAAQIDKIFEEFYRLQPEGPVRGVGLGLYIVRRVMDAHQGQVQVRSEPGQGSWFCLWFPEAEPQTNAKATQT